MSSTPPDDLVLAVARDLVTQLEPQELPLFRITSQQFLQNPERLLAGQRASDDPVGFGAGAAAALLTPAALVVASAVISYLVDEISKAAADKSVSFILETVRRLFQKTEPATPKTDQQLPTLTPNQLAQVRAIALKQARVAQLSDARAKLLADAIVGTLAITMGV